MVRCQCCLWFCSGNDILLSNKRDLTFITSDVMEEKRYNSHLACVIDCTDDTNLSRSRYIIVSVCYMQTRGLVPVLVSACIGHNRSLTWNTPCSKYKKVETQEGKVRPDHSRNANSRAVGSDALLPYFAGRRWERNIYTCTVQLVTENIFSWS